MRLSDARRFRLTSPMRLYLRRSNNLIRPRAPLEPQQLSRAFCEGWAPSIYRHLLARQTPGAAAAGASD